MLVTHLDRNYLPFGKLYLLSAAKNAPDERVYISAANLTTAEVDMLQACNQKAIIVNHEIIVPDGIRYRQYMQCRISKVLVEAYDKFCQQGELCIATNIDVLIRKPMLELYSLIKDKGVLVRMDEEHLVANEILNEVMVLDFDSPVMSSFLTAYNKMWDNGVVYRDDQRQLYKVFYDLIGVNFGQLPPDYTDRFMQPESHIWSARRHNRFCNYNKFLSELGLSEEKTCTNLSWIGRSDGRKEAN